MERRVHPVIRATRFPSASSPEPRRQRRRSAALIAVFVLVVGCGDDGESGAPPTSTTESTPEGSTTSTATTTSSPAGTSTAAPTSTATTSTSMSTATSTSTTTTSTTSLPPEELPADVQPVWPLDFPDPFVLPIGEEYRAYATASGFVQVQRLDSPTFQGWTGPIDALPVRAAWAVSLSAWAPAVIEVDGTYLLYYTARVDGTDKHCISVAEGPNPDGPFVDPSTEPWVCPEELGGAIDPSPFRDEDGSLYLLWKNDGVTLRRESAIFSQRLTADGRSLEGDAVLLIGTDQDWEYPHVEAPSMILVDGTYWLAYSGNWWNQDVYGVGFARCESPAGPCEKPFDEPLVASTPGAEGPGGAEFFIDRWGRPLLAYHAWTGEPGYPGHRALRIVGVDLSGATPLILRFDGG